MSRPLRVLHVAPLWFPICRDAPGGIETFLTALLAGLERAGSQMTLLAAGDSRTAAELVPVVPSSLCDRISGGMALEYAYYEEHQLARAVAEGPGYDLVHSHIGARGLVLSSVPGLRVLHTWHTQVYQDMEWLVGQRPDLWLTAVSEHQARALRAAGATRCQVVPNGIDVAGFPFRPEAGGPGLAFLGRMEHAKGVDLAVGVARRLGRPLVLAGPIVDHDYFRHVIEPALGDDIRYVGPLDHAGKSELLGQAACVLVPSRVEEAFGVVSLEAMACGTPVVALARGALPEIIEPGLTGFVAADPEALAGLTARATLLDRAAIRQRVAARFDVAAVAGRYLRLYEEVIARAASGDGAGSGRRAGRAAARRAPLAGPPSPAAAPPAPAAATIGDSG